MLINPSFFVGEINIPNVGSQAVDENLNIFISKYEPIILQNVLGYSLYKSYQADPTTARMQELIYGGAYGTDDAFYWNGLIRTGESPNAKFSLIADFIFWHWMKSQAFWNSGVGVAIPDKNAAKDISPAIKMNAAWNSGVKQAKGLLLYLSYDTVMYPEYNFYLCGNVYYNTINEFGI